MVKSKHSAIERFLRTEQLRKEIQVVRLTKAHFEKAKENMDFCFQVAEKIPMHPSWVIVSAYYGAYHGALALLAAKGFSSKSHSATIAAIKELYVLSDESISALEHLSQVAVSDLETLKEKRETANYSINVHYDKIVAQEMRLKAEKFLLEVQSLFGI